MLGLQEISDRLEIAQLLVDYATAIDTGNVAGLDRVFTPDAHVDFRAFAEFGGIAGDYPTIRAWFAASFEHARPRWQHLVANSDVRIDGDLASGRIMCLNPIVLPTPEAESGRPAVGFHGLWYLDDYVRTADGWRIASRREEVCFSHNFPASPRLTAQP